MKGADPILSRDRKFRANIEAREAWRSLQDFLPSMRFSGPDRAISACVSLYGK